jgi:hypothetical protein
MTFSYLLEPTGMSLVSATRIRYSARAFVYIPGRRREPYKSARRPRQLADYAI